MGYPAAIYHLVLGDSVELSVEFLIEIGIECKTLLEESHNHGTFKA